MLIITELKLKIYQNTFGMIKKKPFNTNSCVVS